MEEDNKTVPESVEENTPVVSEATETADDHVVTEEDLTNNPGFVDAGIEVGDEIGIPEEVDAPVEDAPVEEEETPAEEVSEETPAEGATPKVNW